MMEFIKNISALIGFCVTVYGVYRAFRTRLRLRVRATHSEFMPLPKMEEQLKAFRAAVESLKWQLRTRREQKSPEEGEMRDAAKGVLDAVPDAFGDQFTEGSLLYLQHRWDVEVENNGQAEAKDLILHVPFDGVVKSDRAGKSEIQDFDQEISLGSLRAKGKIALSIWTHSVYGGSTFTSPKMFVTHTGGTVNAQKAKQLYGFPAHVGWFLAEFGPVPLILVVLWMLPVVGHILSGMKPSTTDRPTTQSTTQPTTDKR